MSDVRTEVVDRVAEALFVADETRTPEQSYDLALAFYEERERRRGEWQRQRESENPLELENHRFQPAQGEPEFCLVCAKRRGLHPIQGGTTE